MDEIAYRDLQPGEAIQAGDQWRAESGQWSQIDQSVIGQTTGVRARRPYNITKLLKQRDEAEQALKMDRASLDETRAAYAVVIEERNEAERALSEERAAHVRTSNDRDRLIVELSECQQQRQHLQDAIEELQRRRDAAEANFQTNTLTVADVVENILSALEIAGHALEYLADVGVNEEAGHYSGFSAAIAVVRKIKESTK